MFQVQDWLLFVLSLFVLYYVTCVHFSRASRILRQQYDGPYPLPFIGNLHSIVKPETMLDTMSGWAKKYNYIVRFFLGSTKPTVMIASPTLLEKAMTSNDLIEKSFMYKWAEIWLGKSSLLLSTGSEWHHMRKVMTPAFHFRILQSFQPVINEKVARLCDSWEAKVSVCGDDPLDIFQDVGRTAFEVICETSMGVTSANYGPEVINEYLELNTLLAEIAIWGRSRKLWSDWGFIWRLTPDGQLAVRSVEKVNALTDKIIHDRKNMIGDKDFAQLERLIQEEKKEDSADELVWLKSSKYKVAFLDLLLLSQREDPHITDEKVRDNTTTILFAGHDTTASAVSWTIYNLGRNPDCQKILHEELDGVFGEDPRKELETADLTKLKYLECCIKESLRMFPSAPFTSRNIKQDFKLDDHHLLPAGCTLMFGIHAVHQNPDIFPHPEKFDPSRFFPENVAGRSHFAFVPFSAGPRNCIGQRFAMLELKIFLAHIFRRFSIEAVDTLDKVVPLAEMVLRPKNGMRVILTKRM